MSLYLEQFLHSWKKPYVRDQELVLLFDGNPSKRHDAVKYALRKGVLVTVRRGLYLINLPGKQGSVDPFELAGVVYGPSYISLESALSVHQWIPEAVYMITSVSTRRKKIFKSPTHVFQYLQVPVSGFYNEVSRYESHHAIYLIAEPWKAMADLIFLYKKNWHSLDEMCAEYRIERDSIHASSKGSLAQIARYYHNSRVQKILLRFLKELNNGYENN